MALEHYKTQILLLHSQQSALDNLSTGFNDRYSVHMATSGTEALNIFTETPVHVIVSAQDLPGMSGLDALREAKKRSPETIGILLAGNNQDDGLEALVGDQEVFQVVRGEISPEALRSLIDSATQQARLLALSESANDTAANVDQPTGEHIIMETSENGSAIISDGTGQMPALQPHKISVAPDVGGRSVDVLVLTRDEEFLATIKDSSRGLHNVHHCVTPTQAEEIVNRNKVGVLVTDAAMVGSNIEVLTQRLRIAVPRLVAVVAGRRDDGELLMDLINRGQVYRFLLKPVSPGRARLAIEASVKHHLDAADKAFKTAPSKTPAKPQRPARQAKPEAKVAATPKASPTSQTRTAAASRPAIKSPAPMNVSRQDSLLDEGLDDAFDDDSSFTETMTGIVVNVGKKISGATAAIVSKPKKAPADPEPARMEPARTEPVRMEPARTEQAPSSSESTPAGPLQNPKTLGIAAAAVIVLAAIGWFTLGSDDAPQADLANEPDALPSVVESDIAATPAIAETTSPLQTLADARAARDEGRLIAPPEQNAIELFMAVLQASPDDALVASEMDAVVGQVFSMAESAILDQRLDEASLSLQMLRLASPDNPRLSFLSAQYSQLQFRRTLDDARIAIRDGRFEDAGSLIESASGQAGADDAEINALSQELAAARSEQQIDEVLALANSRVDQNQLISPSNDNARYYFELALSNDANNAAARQGLAIVASKLVLQARVAIDNEQLADAEDLLNSARSLDASSVELAASAAALANAKDAQAQAELDAIRAAEAEAARIVEQNQIAEQERLAEQQRLVEQQREAEEQRRVAAAAAAALAVAATSDNVDAASPDVSGTEQSPAAQAKSEAEVSGADKEQSDDIVQSAAAAGATTFAMNESVDAGTAAVPTADPATDDNEIDAQTAAAEPENVAVSSLTRVNYVAPKYPRSARRRNMTGSVDVSFLVQKNGTVTDLVVLDSTTGGTFDAAALEAIAQWRFEPTLENGEPVEKKSAVRLAFNLQ